MPPKKTTRTTSTTVRVPRVPRVQETETATAAAAPASTDTPAPVSTNTSGVPSAAQWAAAQRELSALQRPSRVVSEKFANYMRQRRTETLALQQDTPADRLVLQMASDTPWQLAAALYDVLASVNTSADTWGATQLSVNHSATSAMQPQRTAPTIVSLRATNDSTTVTAAATATTAVNRTINIDQMIASAAATAASSALPVALMDMLIKNTSQFHVAQPWTQWRKRVQYSESAALSAEMESAAAAAAAKKSKSTKSQPQPQPQPSQPRQQSFHVFYADLLSRPGDITTLKQYVPATSATTALRSARHRVQPAVLPYDNQGVLTAFALDAYTAWCVAALQTVPEEEWIPAWLLWYCCGNWLTRDYDAQTRNVVCSGGRGDSGFVPDTSRWISYAHFCELIAQSSGCLRYDAERQEVQLIPGEEFSPSYMFFDGAERAAFQTYFLDWYPLRHNLDMPYALWQWAGIYVDHIDAADTTAPSFPVVSCDPFMRLPGLNTRDSLMQRHRPTATAISAARQAAVAVASSGTGLTPQLIQTSEQLFAFVDSKLQLVSDPDFVHQIYPMLFVNSELQESVFRDPQLAPAIGGSAIGINGINDHFTPSEYIKRVSFWRNWLIQSANAEESEKRWRRMQYIMPLAWRRYEYDRATKRYVRVETELFHYAKQLTSPKFFTSEASYEMMNAYILRNIGTRTHGRFDFSCRDAVRNRWREFAQLPLSMIPFNWTSVADVFFHYAVRNRTLSYSSTQWNDRQLTLSSTAAERRFILYIVHNLPPQPRESDPSSLAPKPTIDGKEKCKITNLPITLLDAYRDTVTTATTAATAAAAAATTTPAAVRTRTTTTTTTTSSPSSPLPQPQPQPQPTQSSDGNLSEVLFNACTQNNRAQMTAASAMQAQMDAIAFVDTMFRPALQPDVDAMGGFVPMDLQIVRVVHGLEPGAMVESQRHVQNTLYELWFDEFRRLSNRTNLNDQSPAFLMRATLQQALRLFPCVASTTVLDQVLATQGRTPLLTDRTFISRVQEKYRNPASGMVLKITPVSTRVFTIKSKTKTRTSIPTFPLAGPNERWLLLDTMLPEFYPSIHLQSNPWIADDDDDVFSLFQPESERIAAARADGNDADNDDGVVDDNNDDDGDNIVSDVGVRGDDNAGYDNGAGVGGGTEGAGGKKKRKPRNTLSRKGTRAEPRNQSSGTGAAGGGAAAATAIAANMLDPTAIATSAETEFNDFLTLEQYEAMRAGLQFIDKQMSKYPIPINHDVLYEQMAAQSTPTNEDGSQNIRSILNENEDEDENEDEHNDNDDVGDGSEYDRDVPLMSAPSPPRNHPSTPVTRADVLQSQPQPQPQPQPQSQPHNAFVQGLRTTVMRIYRGAIANLLQSDSVIHAHAYQTHLLRNGLVGPWNTTLQYLLDGGFIVPAPVHAQSGDEFHWHQLSDRDALCHALRSTLLTAIYYP